RRIAAAAQSAGEAPASAAALGTAVAGPCSARPAGAGSAVTADPAVRPVDRTAPVGLAAPVDFAGSAGLVGHCERAVPFSAAVARLRGAAFPAAISAAASAGSFAAAPPTPADGARAAPVFEAPHRSLSCAVLLTTRPAARSRTDSFPYPARG